MIIIAEIKTKNGKLIKILEYLDDGWFEILTDENEKMQWHYQHFCDL